MKSASKHNSDCLSEEIAAYLDGELDATACARLDEHLRECSHCAGEMRAQRVMLHELNFALADESGPLVMPENFARVVAARAQSDMSGVRERGEKRRALGLCVALSVASFMLLGSAAFGESVFAPLRAIWRVGGALLGFLAHALYDAGAGLAVISRGLGGHLFFQSPRGLGLLLLLLLALALLTLARLIVRYHRARIIE